MKTITKILLLIVAVAVAPFIFTALWTTYDYDLRCKNCLHGRSFIVQQFAGIPFWRSVRDDLGAEDAYCQVFGHACEHSFHRGGFGRSTHSLFGGNSVADGAFGDRSFYYSRDMAVSAVFDAENRLGNRNLALASFRFIERLFPSQTVFKSRSSIPAKSHQALQAFSDSLPRANSIQEWKDCLDHAEHDFGATPLPPNI